MKNCGKGLTAGRNRAARGRDRGFTVVELIISMFIVGIVAAAIFTLYNSFYGATRSQDLLLEAQQNARVGIDLMERELVNAGYDAGTADIVTEATANSIEFTYTDPSDNTTVSPTAGQRLKVKYALSTVSGIQYLQRTEKVMPDGTPHRKRSYRGRRSGGLTLTITTSTAR